jgi:hypothetical protein
LTFLRGERRLMARSGRTLRPATCQIACLLTLFDSFKSEAIYQLLISGNLHTFERVTGEP